MFSNKSDVSDKSPILSSRQNYSVRSPSITNNKRNFSFHTQHIGSIISTNSQRKNAGSGLSIHSKSTKSDGVRLNDEVDNTSDLLDISMIDLPNYDPPKCSTK